MELTKKQRQYLYDLLGHGLDRMDEMGDKNVSKQDRDMYKLGDNLQSLLYDAIEDDKRTIIKVIVQIEE